MCQSRHKSFGTENALYADNYKSFEVYRYIDGRTKLIFLPDIVQYYSNNSNHMHDYKWSDVRDRFITDNGVVSVSFFLSLSAVALRIRLMRGAV